jgi:hypothetical protein
MNPELAILRDALGIASRVYMNALVSGPKPQMGRKANFREAVPAQLPTIFIARDATTTIVTSEIALSSIIRILARDVSGSTSVGLNAVAVEKPRNK